MKFKEWKQQEIDTALAAEIAQELKIETLVAKVLLARGMEKEEIERFLTEEQALYDPFLMADMDKAVARIHRAVEEFEPICVYGDYDCDGVTSTAVLYRYLESIGANVTYYIPNRHTEGYGMNKKAIERLSQQGTKLIVTVDNGINAIEETVFANELGMEVIITDHHKPGENLPQAVAVVDPHREDCAYPFKGLAGVGVAFKLICAMEDNQFEEILDFFGDIIAIGTIADVMPLVSENRTIVKHGLSMLVHTDNLGLQELLRLTGLDTKEEITAQDVAFSIAPRINAAGRMGFATDALKLLLSEEEEDALVLAADLFEINEARKGEENKAVLELAGILQKDKGIANAKVLTFVKDNLHQGVIGIVSARILDRYQKPVLIVTNDPESGLYKGSARSIDGFSMKKALDYCADLLTVYGGHDKAAGFSLEKEHLKEFVSAINEYADKTFTVMPTQSVEVDVETTLEELNLANIKGIAVLEPLGEGNKEPNYLLKELLITGVYPMSEGKHTRIRVKRGAVESYINYFKMKTVDFPFQIGQAVDIIVQAKPNLFNGRESVSSTIVDIRLSGLPKDIAQQESLFLKTKAGAVLSDSECLKVSPTREELGVLYKALGKNFKESTNLEFFYINYCKSEMNYAQFLLGLRVLMEEKLIVPVRQGKELLLTLAPVGEKINLEANNILKSLKETRCVSGLCM